MLIKPFFWSVANGVGTRALSFVFFVLISRLITPSDFGVMALALIVALFIDTLVEQGLSSAIVQRQDLSDEHISSTFVYQVCLAILLGLGLWVTAPFVATLLNEPKLTQVLPWIGLASFFNALGHVKQGLFQRSLQFKLLAIRNVVATTLGGLLGFWYAKQGAGVNSLLIMHVSNAALGAAVLWAATTGTGIRFKLSKTKLKELLLFSRSVLGTRIIEVLSSRLDQLLVGHFLGMVALGYYALAIRLYEILIQTVSAPIAAVAYPLFSSEQENKKKLSLSYLRLVEYAGGLSIPIFIGAAATASFFVPAFFGQQWQPAVIYVVIILSIGMFSSIDTFNDVLFGAVGRPDLRFKYALAGLFVWVIAAFVLLPYGAIYAAVVLAIRAVVMTIPRTLRAMSIMQLKLSSFFKVAVPEWAASALMVIVIVAVNYMSFSNGYLQLSLQVLLGGFAYMFSLSLMGSALPRSIFRIKYVLNGL